MQSTGARIRRDDSSGGPGELLAVGENPVVVGTPPLPSLARPARWAGAGCGRGSAAKCRKGARVARGWEEFEAVRSTRRGIRRPDEAPSATLAAPIASPAAAA